MTKYPSNVLRFELDENRMIFVSFRWDNDINREQTNTQPVVSFVYAEGDWAAEWETKYGPIALVHRKELAEGEVAVDRTEAKPGDPVLHHIWPTVECRSLDFSQLAVDDNDLPRRLVDADYDAIFHTLQRFVRGRIDESED